MRNKKPLHQLKHIFPSGKKVKRCTTCGKMICPKCKKGELKEQISIRGFMFKKKKIITFCPLCDYKNEHIFELSKEDVEIETAQRLNLEKKIIQTFETKKEINKK